MAIGDAGDDFSMAAVRAVLRGTAAMMRFLLTRTARSGSSRMRDAFDRRRERAEREIDESWGRGAAVGAESAGEEASSEPPAYRVVWAADADEAREVVTACERLNIEVRQDRSTRSDGIVKIRLQGNYGAVPVEDGGEFDPLDTENPEVARILERFTYTSARTQVAFREAADAAREAQMREAEAVAFEPGCLDPSLPDPAAAARNAHIDFKVSRWDQTGSLLCDALERMGVGCAVRSFTAAGEYIPLIDRTDPVTGQALTEEGRPVPERLIGAEASRIQVVFDARQTPLVEKAVEELMARGVRGLTPERFPGWEANIRNARRKMADLARPGMRQRVYRIDAPDAAQADALVSAAGKCGIAAVAVPPSPDGTVRVYVDPADAVACEGAAETFADRLDAVAEGRVAPEADASVLGVLADAGFPQYGSPSRPGCRHRHSSAVPARSQGAPRPDLEASYGPRQRDTPQADRARAPRMAAEVNRALAPDLAPARVQIPRSRPPR